MSNEDKVSFLREFIFGNDPRKSDRFRSATESLFSSNDKDTKHYIDALNSMRNAISSLPNDFFAFDFSIHFNDLIGLNSKFSNGQFVLAFYGDNRKLDIVKVDHIEKVKLKPYYGIAEKPSLELGKYLADLELTKSMAQTRNNTERAAQIEEWFNRFENILRRIYGEPSLKLDFNIDTFQFSILIEGRDPFDFSTMSMGYAAVFDIVADLMMRMESKHTYDLEGIVLIDEIETHLHVELQRQIVPILTELFPNIQFILSTHSPFILNSAPNAVIYDLEKHMLVEDGMENLSYEGIVEGYFEVDRFSQKLRKYFEEYKQLVTSENLSDLDYARIAELEDYLDEVPDYLALDFAHEYSRLKAEFDS
jgi:predicted ATPase